MSLTADQLELEQHKLGIICTLEEYARQRASNPDPSLHCLTRGQSIGLTVRHVLISPSTSKLIVTASTQIVAESGFVSLFAVLFVFAIIFVCHFR